MRASFRSSSLWPVVKDSDVRLWLAVASIVLVVGILAMIGFNVIPESLKSVAFVVVGLIVGCHKDVYGFYFGSSSGSKDKNATISAMQSDDQA